MRDERERQVRRADLRPRLLRLPPGARDAEYLRDIMSQRRLLDRRRDDVDRHVAGRHPERADRAQRSQQGWGFGERIFQGIINNIALEQLDARQARRRGLRRRRRHARRRCRTRSSSASRWATSSARCSWRTTRRSSTRVLQVGAANWSLLFERSRQVVGRTACRSRARTRRCSTPTSWSRCSRWRWSPSMARPVAGIDDPGHATEGAPDDDVAPRRAGPEPRRVLPGALARADAAIAVVRGHAVRLRRQDARTPTARPT